MTSYIYVENLTAINSDKRGEKIPYCSLGWKLYQIPWIYVDKYIHNKIWFSTKFPILNLYLSKQLVCNNCFVFDGVYLSITLPWSKIFGLYEPLCLFWDTYFLPFQSIEIRCLGFSKAGLFHLCFIIVESSWSCSRPQIYYWNWRFYLLLKIKLSYYI